MRTKGGLEYEESETFVRLRFFVSPVKPFPPSPPFPSSPEDDALDLEERRHCSDQERGRQHREEPGGDERPPFLRAAAEHAHDEHVLPEHWYEVHPRILAERR